MSPRVNRSRAGGAAAAAWSRDARPNASGVTYSRSSYYYDREFSDSILYFDSDLGGRHAEREDHFARGRVLQSAGGGGAGSGDDDSAYELKAYAAAGRSPTQQQQQQEQQQQQQQQTTPRFSKWALPSLSEMVTESGDDDDNDDALGPKYKNGHFGTAEAWTKPSGARPYARESAATTTTIATAPAPPADGSTIAGLDVQSIAQGVVVAADILVRLAETYQRARDGEGGGGLLAADVVDPYHLEAGPPSRRAARNSLAPPRALVGVRGRPGEAAAAAAAVLSSSSSSWTVGIKTCYYLLATVVFGVMASFGFALWWAQSRGDVSAGFTIGGYLVAVDALFVAVAGVVHRPACRCWKA